MLIAPAVALSLSIAALPVAAPALAQEAETAQEPGLLEWGLDYGMSLFGDSVAEELEPLADMKALMDQFGPAIGPAMEKLMALVDDMTNYDMPVMLENGDILIRRKPDAPVVEPPADQGITL